MSPVKGQRFPSYEKDTLEGYGNTQRGRQRRPILAGRGEVVFTSVDMKTYRTKPKSEAGGTERSAGISERVDSSVSDSKNDDNPSTTSPPDKSGQRSPDVHGTKRLKALLVQEANQSVSKRKTNQDDKQFNNYASSQPTPSRPRDRYAFVKNVKPAMVKQALQYAKPITENVKVKTPRKMTSTTETEVIPKPKQTEEVKYLKDKSTTEKNLDVRRFVRTLRNECEHVGLLWIAPPIMVGSAVFLVLVLAMCASFITATILSLIPFLEKLADEAFRKLCRCGYLHETEDESTCRDFLEKLICQVETRTKTKIKEQLKKGLSPKDL